MPRSIPEARYFSIPPRVVGGVGFKNDARNWSPWVRSLAHTPLAWTNSPGEIKGAWPTIVMGSRCPRAVTRNTQNPLSGLWNTTRSTRPARFSVGALICDATIRPCAIGLSWRPGRHGATSQMRAPPLLAARDSAR